MNIKLDQNDICSALIKSLRKDGMLASLGENEEYKIVFSYEECPTKLGANAVALESISIGKGKKT